MTKNKKFIVIKLLKEIKEDYRADTDKKLNEETDQVNETFNDFLESNGISKSDIQVLTLNYGHDDKISDDAIESLQIDSTGIDEDTELNILFIGHFNELRKIQGLDKNKLFKIIEKIIDETNAKNIVETFMSCRSFEYVKRSFAELDKKIELLKTKNENLELFEKLLTAVDYFEKFHKFFDSGYEYDFITDSEELGFEFDDGTHHLLTREFEGEVDPGPWKEPSAEEYEEIRVFTEKVVNEYKEKDAIIGSILNTLKRASMINSLTREDKEKVLLLEQEIKKLEEEKRIIEEKKEKIMKEEKFKKVFKEISFLIKQINKTKKPETLNELNQKLSSLKVKNPKEAQLSEYITEKINILRVINKKLSELNKEKENLKGKIESNRRSLNVLDEKLRIAKEIVEKNKKYYTATLEEYNSFIYKIRQIYQGTEGIQDLVQCANREIVERILKNKKRIEELEQLKQRLDGILSRVDRFEIVAPDYPITFNRWYGKDVRIVDKEKLKPIEEDKKEELAVVEAEIIKEKSDSNDEDKEEIIVSQKGKIEKTRKLISDTPFVTLYAVKKENSERIEFSEILEKTEDWHSILLKGKRSNGAAPHLTFKKVTFNQPECGR